MSYYYPSYSFNQSQTSPTFQKRSDSLNINGNNIISLNRSKYTPTKLTSMKLSDMGPLDKINSIENKLKSIDNQMDVRTNLFDNFLSKSNPNVGIFNPYIGNPVLGMNPNNNTETTKRLSKPINSQPKTRLESIEYQNLLQEQLIHQRKEKLQENNFQINNLIFQEIDEMADNLDLFKIEMFNHVRKLERNQEKLNLGEVLDELTHMRDYFKSTLDRQEKKKDREMMILKEDIGLMRDELTDNFRYETKQNRDIFKNMNNEVRSYQENINARMDEMDSKQKIQLSGIRNMLRRRNDDNTQNLAEQFMNEKDRRSNKRKTRDEDEVVEPRRRGAVLEEKVQDEEEVEFDDDGEDFDTTNVKDKYNSQRDKEKKKEFEKLKSINTNNNFK
jgi:hypothetical protein